VRYYKAMSVFELSLLLMSQLVGSGTQMLGSGRILTFNGYGRGVAKSEMAMGFEYE
jgi:hypothetical protein